MTKIVKKPDLTNYDDQRREERIQVFKAAKIINPETGSATDCAVLDFTSCGAKIRLVEHFDIPIHFNLIFVAARTVVQVEKIWQQQTNAGVRFISPPKLLDDEVVVDG